MNKKELTLLEGFKEGLLYQIGIEGEALQAKTFLYFKQHDEFPTSIEEVAGVVDRLRKLEGQLSLLNTMIDAYYYNSENE